MCADARTSRERTMDSIRTEGAARSAANRLPEWSAASCAVFVALTLCAWSVEAPHAPSVMADGSAVAAIATRSSEASAAWLPAPGVRREVPVWSQLTCRAARDEARLLLGWSSIAGSVPQRSPAPWIVLLDGGKSRRPDPSMPA
jgi:hypothetical protein